MAYANGNLIDYVSWRGDLSIDSYPLNEVDFLLLSRLVYSPLTWLYMDGESRFLPIRELAGLLLHNKEIQNFIPKELDLTLYELLVDSSRFGSWPIGYFADVLDLTRELQFSAFVVHIRDDLHAFVYRGTDNTIVGAKEDLNMTFQCPVEAQTMALRYFNEIAAELDGEFVLCGHSKGGNLAAYAASFCDYDLQERIRTVYNFDGPGFDEMVLVTPQYRNICDRIRTYLPQASMVGILLGHLEEHTVVHSSAPSMPMQHDVYTWDICRDHFAYEEGTTRGSCYFDHTMADWLKGLTKQQREEFVDAIYMILEKMSITSITDLKRNWLGNSLAFIQVFGSIEEEDRKEIAEGFHALMKSAWTNMNLKGTVMGKLHELTEEAVEKKNLLMEETEQLIQEHLEKKESDRDAERRERRDEEYEEKNAG